MRTVNLVITTDDKRIIERFTDSDSAINRFEEAKHFNGVKKLFMTFADGSSWSWSNNELTINGRISSIDNLISGATARSKETNVETAFENDKNIEME